MKANTTLRVFCRMGLALAFVSPVIAQTVTPAQPPASATTTTVIPQVTSAAPTASTDDLVVMSPFTVSVEKERGYLATETLAGMRLRTDLKDVGAAIDVLTEEFLNDVGAVDLSDALLYVANMSYADFPSDEDANNDGQANSFTYVSRGINGNTILMDFFENGSIPTDRYNSENLTFLRGANAILFGIGSPSGIVGSSTKRASLSKNITTLRLMFDKFGSRRFDFDSDITLLHNKLGIRVTGVLSDKESFQTPSKNERNGLFLTASYRPFRKTKITANIEWGEYNRLHVINNYVADAYTPWVEAGSPTVNFVTGKGMTSAWVPTDTADSRKQKYNKSVGSGLQQGSPLLVYIEGSGLPVMDWRYMPRGAAHTLDVASMDVPWTPGTMFKTDNDKMIAMPFTPENTIIDLDANIWGNLNNNNLDYNRQAVFAEQGLAKGLDLELAANHAETTYLFNWFSRGNTTIFVDASEVLPDGSPNPYVGMPYIETGNNHGPNRVRDRQEFTTYRATLSYEMNLDKYKVFRSVGWGNYRFAGLYQRHESKKQQTTSYLYINDDPTALDGRKLNDNVLKLSRRYYLQPGESVYKTDGTKPAPQATIPGGTGVVSTWGLNLNEYNIDYGNTGNYLTNSRRSTDSLVFALQGSWWYSRKGWAHVTGMFGMRYDVQKERKMRFDVNDKALFPNAPGTLDGLDNLGRWNDETELKANPKSYNITFRPIAAIRLFYNYSDIYVSPDVNNNRDFFNNTLRPTRGVANDYGMKIDLFKGRLFLTATKYKTEAVDRWIAGTSTIYTALNYIYETLEPVDGNKYHLDSPSTYRDDSTEGYEFSLNATPVRGWNMRVAVGTQDTIVGSYFDDVVTYFEQMTPYWEMHWGTDLVRHPSTYSTVGGAVDAAKKVLRDQRALIGKAPTGLRKYNVSFNTNYTFNRGFLKGLRMGCGVRWQSKNTLGYARDPDSTSANIDTKKPFWGDELWTTDLSIGYGRRFLKNKVEWGIQLNVTNVFNDHDPMIRQAVDDGSGNPVYVRWYGIAPIGFQLTNSFKF